MIEELISRVFATRNIAHLEHWKTKSYSDHVALGDLYDGLIDEIDNIVETYQGFFGLVNIKSIEFVNTNDVLSHLKEESEWIEVNRDVISNGVNAVANLIDGLSGLYLKIINRLENFK